MPVTRSTKRKLADDEADEGRGILTAAPSAAFSKSIAGFRFESASTTASNPTSKPAEIRSKEKKNTRNQQHGPGGSDAPHPHEGGGHQESTTNNNRRTQKKPKHNKNKNKSPNVTKKHNPPNRTTSSYAPPSKYSHLTPLTDILTPNLICVFVGTNPGIQTATSGHAYAHPSNHFWKLLHSSGLTPDRRLRPDEDATLPARYCMGNTNIVERPSLNAAELSREEMTAGAGVLHAKFRKYRPEAVCIVGKGIWEAIWRWKYGRNPKPAEFSYGWQDESENMGKSEGGGGEDGEEDGEEFDADGQVWNGSRVFVTTSTSGLAASIKPPEREAIWRPFGDWVNTRRAERGFEISSGS